MKWLKDFIYDKSDLTIALVILVAAALVIFTRIEAIIDYPETLARQSVSSGAIIGQSPAFEQEPDDALKPDDTPKSPADPSQTGSASSSGAVGSASSGGGSASSGAGSGGSQEKFSVYIHYGEPLQSVADKFVSIGIFPDSDAFFNSVQAANAGTRIKAGNFVIPADATPEQVIEIITR